MKLNLINQDTNQTKNVKVGFSWTTLFFGPFVPLFRKDWKWFGIMLSVTVLTVAVSVMFDIEPPSGIVGIIFSFFYNNEYIKDLVTKGWEPLTQEDEDIYEEKVH
ncbi:MULTISPECIES: DUF2628 domain-containing protein [Streptococcus]|uniref:DUF2628 domain-containing protein n=1 Tax=Streptococcus pluranimalium TaxID=82348 RepID=A0A345VJL3_9STRE|nr:MULTISPECIES: DUF2628 domain-containing protein [Streptococcus]AXJ12915.1 hypothetical protein Sp14A_09940 [Streptococcus pluranimalium]